MALHQCPDCNTAISTSAPACPHCGRPNSVDPDSCSHPAFTEDRSWRAERAVKGFLTFLLSLVAVGGVVGSILEATMMSPVGFLIGFVLAVFVAYFAIRGLKYPLVCASCGRPAPKGHVRNSKTEQVPAH